MLYGLMILVVIVMIILTGGYIGAFVDAPSIVLIFLISLPTVFMSGLFKDFAKGFKMNKANVSEYSLQDIEKSLLAWALFGKNLILAGVIGTIIGGVQILGRLDDVSKLGPSLAVAILTTFYAILIGIFAITIHTKLKALLIDKKNKS